MLLTKGKGRTLESIYYQKLGPYQRSYDAALRCYRSLGQIFSIAGDVSPRDLCLMVQYDHPELFYVNKDFRLYPKLFGKDIRPDYMYSGYDIKKISKQLEDIAASIIAELINAHQSDFDKVRVLHDYLKTNLQYDTRYADERVFNRENLEAHSVVGALIHHKCVCEGFAKAMKYLCDRISLECWVVKGEANNDLSRGNHAWNIVCINGYYHHVDVTWDNPTVNLDGFSDYSYLNLSDSEIGRDHTWKRDWYPACPSSPYNYFRVTDSLLDSKVQLDRFLYESFSREDEFVMFRVERGSTLEREIMGYWPDAIEKASARCRYVRVDSWKYGSVPEQLTYYMKPQYTFL